MANLGLWLDTRRNPNSKNEYPLRIRIAFDGKTRYLETDRLYTVDDWRKIEAGKRLSESLMRDRSELDELLKAAKTVADHIRPFDYPKYKSAWKQYKEGRNTSQAAFQELAPAAASLDLEHMLRKKSEKLFKEEKFASASLNKQAADMVAGFAPGAILTDLTPDFLRNMQAWASKPQIVNGVQRDAYSITTIGMYMARIRTIFNDAMDNRLVSRDAYPFGRRAYVIPSSVNNKRPLELDDILKIYNFEPRSQPEAFARDMFLFSYFANGMNPADIFHLTWKQVDTHYFSFYRQKNLTKPGAQVQITVVLDDELKSIIDRQGKPEAKYVFDVINDNMSQEEKHRRIKSVIGNINQSLKFVAKRLGITTKISSIYARHSYTTRMQEGLPLAQLSRDLGHKSIKTTENYLSQLPNSKRAAVRKRLLND